MRWSRARRWARRARIHGIDARLLAKMRWLERLNLG